MTASCSSVRESVGTLAEKKGLARVYVRCKGGNDEVGSHGWTIGTQASFVPAFSKPAKVGPAAVTSQKGEGQNPHPNVAEPG